MKYKQKLTGHIVAAAQVPAMTDPALHTAWANVCGVLGHPVRPGEWVLNWKPSGSNSISYVKPDRFAKEFEPVNGEDLPTVVGSGGAERIL